MKHKPILFYHNIGKENYKSFSTTIEFEAQMKFLYKRKLNGTNCDNLNNLKSNFGISFDDGYEDNLINALPILKKYNFTATCFIVPNLIGKTNSWDTKQFKLMDKQQIQDWLDAGMNIGSHSMSHKDLTKLGEDKIISEVGDSKKILEDNFGIKINNFSYPYGKINRLVTNKVEKAGYIRAFTTKRGLYNALNNSQYMINRVPVSRGIGMFKFWLKTNTYYENL